MISPDDPRLTAHADGALPPAEAARFERELAGDPAARAELERLRGLQRALREAFAEETADEGVFAAAETGAEPAPIRPEARRPYSVYRDALDAREEARGWRPLVPETRAREHPLAWLFPGWLARVAAAACVLLLVAAIVIPPVVRLRETARRSVDAANLRQIGREALAFAGWNTERNLPEATDVWDFARQLASNGGLNDATIWQSSSDPASDGAPPLSTVLAAGRDVLEPSFVASRPAYAVPLGKIKAGDPATTPIAWTRGLQADGTWAAHSPYGRTGGRIMFLDGNVAFYSDVRDRLVRYDGKGSTSNILEALPPGVRIGEYTPTATEQTEWAKTYRSGQKNSFLSWARHSPFFLPVLAGICVLVAVLFLVRRRTS